MPQILLSGGFYVGRSLIANAQRCLNLYPEKNPEDAPSPYTLYLTPGLTALREADAVDGPASGVSRGGYTASDGTAFCVVGQTLYRVDANWVFTELGVLSGALTTPVSMYDNGATLFIVDGSTNGYTLDLTTYAFAQIGAVDNFFGSVRVDYCDTFIIFARPDTKNFYCTDSNSSVIDPLSIGIKSGLPDPISVHICMHREVWLLGTNRSTEIWYNAGAAQFPFERSPGVFIEQGCIAPYSLCKHDSMIFWLSRDKDGFATVFMGQPGGKITRISTPAIAAFLGEYDGDELASAIGMTYKQLDHAFYLLSLSDVTLAYDISEGLWHERCYIDSDGNEEPIRPNWITLMHNTLVGGDRENGTLYKIDLEALTDDEQPITRRRGFRHLVSEGNQASYPQFRAYMASGEAPDSEDSVPVYLRWSDDGGRSWGNAVEGTLGLGGNYINIPRWNQLGVARDRIFELFWSAPVKTALNCAWISEPQVAKTS